MEQINNYLHLIMQDLKSFVVYVNSDPVMFFEIAVILCIILGISLLLHNEKKRVVSTSSAKQSLHSADKDYAAIAGEDMIGTQLDLAKAYIEMDQPDMAKKILGEIIDKGNTIQKQEARDLIDSL